MTETFIRNEQFNYIKKQVAQIKDSAKKNVPTNVHAAVIDLANANIHELFPFATKEQRELLDLSKLKKDEEYVQYIQRLSPLVMPFKKITEQQLKKMFPKSKKVKLPDLELIDHNHLTYLGWNDLRSNKKFIVYELDGEMVGIECTYTATSKKNYCSVCHSMGEVAYFFTITKAKQAKNPDYYKSIGNLICVDSTECNKKITNVDYLTTFIEESLAKKK